MSTIDGLIENDIVMCFFFASITELAILLLLVSLGKFTSPHFLEMVGWTIVITMFAEIPHASCSELSIISGCCFIFKIIRSLSCIGYFEWLECSETTR